jgi:hypothetical protein
MALNLARLAPIVFAAGLAFLFGAVLARVDDPTLDAPPTSVVVAPPAGDYLDVPMVMRSELGTSFRFLCDFHFPDDPKQRRAECEYTDP